MGAAALRERLDAVGAQAEAAAAAVEPILPPPAADSRFGRSPTFAPPSPRALLLPLGALALDAALDANTDDDRRGWPLRRASTARVRARIYASASSTPTPAAASRGRRRCVNSSDLIRRKAEDVVTTIVDGGRCLLDGGAAQLLSWRPEGAGAAAADDVGSARSRSKGARAGTATCGARPPAADAPPSRAARCRCS